LFFTNMVVEGV